MRVKTETISFVTTPEIAEALRKAAADQERSLSWVIGKALSQYLGIQEAPKPVAPRKRGSR